LLASFAVVFLGSHLARKSYKKKIYSAREILRGTFWVPEMLRFLAQGQRDGSPSRTVTAPPRGRNNRNCAFFGLLPLARLTTAPTRADCSPARDRRPGRPLPIPTRCLGHRDCLSKESADACSELPIESADACSELPIESADACSELPRECRLDGWPSATENF